MRLPRQRTDTSGTDRCTCTLTVEGGTATLSASSCDGNLECAPDCRGRLVEGIDRTVEQIIVRRNGLEYHYPHGTVTALVTAAQFAERVRSIDEQLASRAIRHPWQTAATVDNRADTVGMVAAEVGFTGLPVRHDQSPARGLTIGNALIEPNRPAGGTLRTAVQLSTGAVARVYETDGRPCYTLEPAGFNLEANDREELARAREAIATGQAADPVEALAGEPELVPILEKYTTGFGILEDCFADPAVSDVFVTAPVGSNPLRIVRDGESLLTNIRLREQAVDALASRLRRASGRSFSRASPTVDATIRLASGQRLRVAGVSEPVSPGLSFALREQDQDSFTLPRLIANGTVTPAVAALLSFAVERNVAGLVAGTRGAGKTTLLGALLFELPPSVRTVIIEDTRELPITQLQALDRDVQGLRTGTSDGPELSPAEALRTALRLGDGALVVGEIRGTEATVLYEAMRVGANANAVLGTIHGDGAVDVHERVTADLGVPPSSFATTDLIVTVQIHRHGNDIQRRVARVEEVFKRDGAIAFEPLFDLNADGIATETGRIDRGESHLLDTLARPSETYASVLDRLGDRRDELAELARDGLVAPTER